MHMFVFKLINIQRVNHSDGYMFPNGQSISIFRALYSGTAMRSWQQKSRNDVQWRKKTGDESKMWECEEINTKQQQRVWLILKVKINQKVIAKSWCISQKIHQLNCAAYAFKVDLLVTLLSDCWRILLNRSDSWYVAENQNQDLQSVDFSGYSQNVTHWSNSPGNPKPDFGPQIWSYAIPKGCLKLFPILQSLFAEEKTEHTFSLQ